MSTDIPAGYHRDERGALWPDACTCGGRIGAPCPVCNPPAQLTLADARRITDAIWGGPDGVVKP